MKILHLIIYSGSIESNDNITAGAYEKMQITLSNYYKKFNKDVYTYFIVYNNDIKKKYNKEYFIKDDILYIDGQENRIPGIIDKTLLSMEYLNYINYDYCVRSNISTIIEFNRLIENLKNKPIEYYGSGLIVDLQWLGMGVEDKKHFGTKFASGTSIIFTKNAVNDIIKNKSIIDRNIIDDVSFGIFVKDYKNIEPIQIDFKYFCEVPFFNKTLLSRNLYIENIKNNKFIFFRNKCFGIYVKNREIDAEQMEILIDSLNKNVI
mgnify:CR=1 FL=1